MTAARETPLTVYYNGACPICGAEVRHYQELAERDDAALTWVDVSVEPQALAAHGIDVAGAKRRLHAKQADGDLVAGVEAFAQLWERLPRYRWLSRLSRVPVVRPLAEVVYERVLAPLLVVYNGWRDRRTATTSTR